jgi:AraC-like DNA-binding protein
MSFQAMSWAVDHKLPSMQKIVLLMMANRFNEDHGCCWPSHDLLAEECGMDKRSIIRQIDKLTELNLIQVIKSKDKNNMNKPNKYILNTWITGEIRLEKEKKMLSDRESLNLVTESHFHGDRESLRSDRESLFLVTESHSKQLYETIKETVIETVIAQSAKIDEQIFDFWKTTFNHHHSIFDAKRKKIIKTAISLGFTPDQLKQAIVGCSKTPHNIGRNETGTVYDGIHIIFKDSGQIERFMNNAISPPIPQVRQGYAAANQQESISQLSKFIEKQEQLCLSATQ